MATYLIAQEIAITRQEGDLADVVFVVPDVLSMTGKEATFKVNSDKYGSFIAKESSAGDITIVGQTITIPLLAADTKDKKGRHRWELEVTGPITIGRGVFNVIKELIV